MRLDLRAKALGKKITLISTAFVLAVSTLTASLPFVLSSEASAVSHTVDVADLSATVASAQDGDVINVTGTGTIATTVVITKDITIHGDGAVIQTTGGNNVFSVAQAGATIENLTIDKTDLVTQNLIQVLASNVSILNNTLTGEYNIGEGEVSRGLEITGSLSGLTISGNIIQNLRQPAYINNLSSGVISGNFINQTRGWVLTADTNFSFSGNTFGENAVGIAFISQGSASNTYTCEVMAQIKANNPGVTIDNQVFSNPCFAAPTNLQPVNNAATNDPNFAMTWNTVNGASVYEYRTSNSQIDATTLGPIAYQDSSATASNYIIGTQTVTRGNNGTPANDWFWQVRAGDGNGNWSPWSVINKVTTDYTAPEAPVHLTPANNAVQSSNNFFFDWTDVAGAARYEIQNSQSAATKADGSFQNVQWTGDYQQVQPTESRAQSVGASGVWYWQVRAIDAAGNASGWTTPWKITIDSSAPTLTLTNPADGELFGGVEAHSLRKDTISVQGTASDERGLKAYCVKLTAVGSSEGACVTNGYYYAPANGTLPTVTIPTTNLTSGEYVVKARIVDFADNVTEVTRTIAVDNTKANITTSINNGQTLAGTVAVDLLSNELHPKIANIRVSNAAGATVAGLYDANAQSPNATLTWNTRDVADGSYQIQYSLRDAVGNSATTIFRTITVDNDYEGPAVEITSPTGSTGNTDSVLVTATTGDAVTYDVTVNGTKVVDRANTPFNGYAVDTTAGGSYTVIVTGYDQFGNSTSDSVTFTVDNTPPTVVTNLEDDEVVAGAVFINSEVSDGEDESYAITIQRVGTPNVTVATSNNLNYLFDTTTYANGEYRALVTAQDQYGNPFNRSINFFIANSPVVSTPTQTPASPPVNAQQGEGDDASQPNGGFPLANFGAAQQVLGTDTTIPQDDNDGSAEVAGSATENLAQAVDADNNDGTAMGLAWYWWLLILAAIATIIWGIVAAIRGRQSV